ncbi:MAG: tyrosine-type recombinase/integrase [Thermoguttaceae bacterium]
MKQIPSIRFHKKGYYFIRIEGKDHYLGKDKREAQLEADLILADYLRRRNRPTTPVAIGEELTIEEIGVRFLVWAKGFYQLNGRDTGVFSRFRLSIQLLIDMYGNSRPSLFGPLALKQVREKMIESGLARSTINMRINIVRQCFRWGAENELCNASVYHALQTVRGLQKGRSAAKEVKQVLPVKLEIVEATLQHLPPIVADMVRLQMYTGMRSSELINLRFKDIDRSKHIWLYTPVSHKTEGYGKIRTVRFGPRSKEILQKYFEHIEDLEKAGYVFNPRQSLEICRKRRASIAKKHKPLSLKKTRAGEKYRRDSYRNAIKRACAKAGVSHWFPHQLRHLAGTLAREVGGLDAAQQFLGHSNASVTEIYAQVNNAKADSVAEIIG